MFYCSSQLSGHSGGVRPFFLLPLLLLHRFLVCVCGPFFWKSGMWAGGSLTPTAGVFWNMFRTVLIPPSPPPTPAVVSTTSTVQLHLLSDIVAAASIFPGPVSRKSRQLALRMHVAKRSHRVCACRSARVLQCVLTIRTKRRA